MTSENYVMVSSYSFSTKSCIQNNLLREDHTLTLSRDDQFCIELVLIRGCTGMYSIHPNAMTDLQESSNTDTLLGYKVYYEILEQNPSIITVKGVTPTYT